MNHITFKGIHHELPSTDSQRSKVYKAEREVFSMQGQEFKTRRGMEGRLNRLAKSATVAKLRREFGLLPITRGKIRVDIGRAGAGSTSFGGYVKFSRSQMCETTLLHELSHEVAPRAAHHHWPFAYVYLRLVSRFFGTEMAKSLKAAFRKHGVRFKPKQKRNLTPEQKAAAAERLRLGRLKGKTFNAIIIDDPLNFQI